VPVAPCGAQARLSGMHGRFSMRVLMLVVVSPSTIGTFISEAVWGAGLRDQSLEG
jgi:hypothetical protein